MITRHDLALHLPSGMIFLNIYVCFSALIRFVSVKRAKPSKSTFPEFETYCSFYKNNKGRVAIFSHCFCLFLYVFGTMIFFEAKC